MAINERAMNAYIAEAMQEFAPPNYTVRVEEHGVALEGNTSPDFIVEMPYGLRTIIETEYDAPAIGDARARLGYQFRDYLIPMKSVLAVGIPERLGNLGHFERRPILRSGEPQFLMQVVTGRSEDDPNIRITPERPALVALQDLAQYAWLAAIPEPYAKEVVDRVIRRLQAAKKELTGLLRISEAATQEELTRRYGNHDSGNGLESVAGNVVGTLASMIQLHMNLKEWGSLGQIQGIDAAEFWQGVEPYNGIAGRIAREWRKIEGVDYMPLSTIAAGMLEDTDLSAKLGGALRVIQETMAEYIQAGISATNNVAAEIWQALIPDRDQRAAYYTKPATAEMLANLTSARLADPAAARYNEICAGTGTIARATEENIRFRHYAAKTAPEDKVSIHAQRMEGYIQLTDINPQSISVATANMASLEPETAFKTSSIFAITSDGGSLNFLTAEGVANLGEGIIGSHGTRGEMLTVIPNTIGICCNNDPYFRPRGGARSPISSSVMAGYKRLADRRVDGVAHGQAGLATFMHVIEHEMLGYGCPHGKVLPLTAAHSESYKGFRRNIEREYCEVIAISTAAGDGTSMSADTGIQEMLLIGSKQTNPNGNGNGNGHWQNGDRAVTCVNLKRTFGNKLEAKLFADAIQRELALGKPSGEIVVGVEVGTYYRMTGLGEGNPWAALGTGGEYTTLTQWIIGGSAWDPATSKVTPFELPITTLGAIARRGPGDDLIGKVADSRSPRGAFEIHPAGDTASRNNPSMWGVDSETQIAITCQPTHYGVPSGSQRVIAQVRETAGHFHLNRNLNMSSGKIAACYTPESCIGGRAWTTLHSDPGVAESITLFLNSTYGVIVRAGYGEATNLGRSTMGVTAVDGHPIPDFANDSDAGRAARRIAGENFERLRQLELERISLSVLDENRAELDRVVTLMLGLPWNGETEQMLDTWRRLMCLQPGVNAGNRETRKRLAAAGVGAD